MSVSRQALSRKDTAVNGSSVKSGSLENPLVFLAGWQLIFWVSYSFFFGWLILTVPPAGHHLASLIGWRQAWHMLAINLNIFCMNIHIENGKFSIWKLKFQISYWNIHIFHWEQMYRNMNTFITVILYNIFLQRLVSMSLSSKRCSSLYTEQINFLLSWGPDPGLCYVN